MAGFTGWDLLLLLVASYLAVMMLIALMRIRRDEVMLELEVEIAEKKKQQELKARRDRTRQRHEEHAQRLRAIQERQQQQNQRNDEEQLLKQLDAQQNEAA